LESLFENNYLLFLSMGVFIFIALAIIVRYRRQIKKLSIATEVLVEEGRILPRVYFEDQGLQKTWGHLKRQKQEIKQLCERATAAPSLADFGASIVRNTSDIDSISSSLADIILDKSSSEIIGLAVVVKDLDETIRVSECRGVPKKRLNQTLLSCADYFFDDPSRFQNKFLDSSVDSRFDFTLFDIGQSIFRPLIDNGQCHGLLWIGVSNGSLSPEMFKMLEGVVDYASASLGSFKAVKQRVDGKDSEKDFLLGLSHDLRSPCSRALFSIREILYQGDLSSEQQESLKIAEDSIVEQIRMLDNVLDIAKHDSGLLDPVQRKISLQNFLENIISRFKYEYQHKGLSLELACDLPIQLFADHEHLSRIFKNLLSNALKFTEAGGVFVEVLLENKTALISFTDTGVGITDSQKERVFKRFDQGGEVKKKGGVGLGLFLSKTLAERNGGHLYHEHAPFGGSKFVLELPILSVEDHSSVNSKMLFESILIVEDDSATARMFRRYLSPMFKEVSVVQSLAQAHREIKRKIPSVVLSDFHLGDLNAASFFASLPEDIPLVVVSGGAVPIQLEREAAYVVMQKPVDKEELCQAIASLGIVDRAKELSVAIHA